MSSTGVKNQVIAVLILVFVAVPFGFVAWKERGRDHSCEARERQCGLMVGSRVRLVRDGTPGTVIDYRCGQVVVRFSANSDTRETRVGCYEVERDNRR